MGPRNESPRTFKILLSSATLRQLRFGWRAETSSQRNLYPQVCAHAGRK